MRVAIFKHQNPKKQWCVLFPNGRKVCGYVSADHAREVAERCGSHPVILNKDAEIKALSWKYVQSGSLEFWRAELGNQILATAERSNPEDFWKTTILGKESPATASITELAQLLQKQLNQN